MSYVELHACSAFSFLRGGSLPKDLAEAAKSLEMPAMALLDRNGVYGSPRFAARARELDVQPIVGSELTMEDGSILPVLVKEQKGYTNLCSLLTEAHLRSAVKGECAVRWNELPQFSDGLVALLGKAHLRRAPDLTNAFGKTNIYVEIQRHFLRGEEKKNRELIGLAEQKDLPLLATNGVLYATRSGREVVDVFTCLREHTHLDAAGKLLAQNAERHLKSNAEMRELFRDRPEAITNTKLLADRLKFSLKQSGYAFPDFPVPPGESMDSWLSTQVWAGAKDRYGRISKKVRKQIEQELALIQKLKFSGYFLIVWDIVNFCRDSEIMVQGRGSAANSAVCFCLSITPIDPVKNKLVFERFLTESRKGWPDIDLDLPSGDRREKVIQEIYQRYGKHGAAMTANVITYRGRSAARELGKALNFSPSILDRFSNFFANGDFPHTMDLEAQIERAGLPKTHPRMSAFVRLYKAIHGLPRHLGQHSGGMIICQNRLSKFVPLENASMPGRVVAQWDKDDCEDLRIVKVDLLGLGMMAVMQDALTLCKERDRPIDLAKISKKDSATYKLMQKADTIGVFQIESRAQMATLPRLKPKSFYDIVIEVAIIRPGPIQGDMVHPYLARRAKLQNITYFHRDLEPLLKPILKRTLGVPLFQEQMLKIAMEVADFSGDEAEDLRRALSFHRSEEKMNKVSVKLRAAMTRKNLDPEVIEKIMQAITSFALYGFPESHAISFAMLAYGSAYLKVHRAPEFYASLLNNQPMGFYSSATLVKDARRHGVKTLPVCVEKSDWNCTVISNDEIRLGFCVVNGLRREHAEGFLCARNEQRFTSLDDFQKRTSLMKEELRALSLLGALNCFAEHRRDAMWHVEKVQHEDLLTRRNFLREATCKRSPLSPMTLPERIRADYEQMNLTTGPHPMKLLRDQLTDIWRASDLAQAKHGSIVRIAGNVICRQRPGTAKGFVFISLEDETGVSNAIVEPDLFERTRLLITEEPFLVIEGVVQNTDNVVLIKTRKILSLAHDELVGAGSHDFH